MTRPFLIAISLLVFLTGAVSTRGARLFDAPAAARSPSTELVPLSKGLERLPIPGSGQGAARHTESEQSHFKVNIFQLLPTLAGKSPREVDDQLRDWALYGTLVQLGLSPRQLVASTQHLAPVRLAYLDDSFVFEYGRGRRAIIQDDTAVLFYQQGDPDQQQTLGRLADQVRMELGHIPQTLYVFRFAADLGAGMLRVDREAKLAGATMFSPATGYFEQEVHDARALAAFLSRTDSLATAFMQNGTLVLGGRQYAHSRTRNLQVADVAALYQAHESLDTQRQQGEDELARINRDYQTEPRDHFTPGFDFSSALARAFVTAEIKRQRRLAGLAPEAGPDSLHAKYQALADRIPRVPAEPGFSLDPQWNIPALLGELDHLPPLYCQATGACDELRQIATDLRSADGDATAQQRALRPLERNSQNRDGGLAALGKSFLIQMLHNRYKLQCARYDGPLQGTRVGMNLFYTDLIAKLWMGVDLYRSAPVRQLPGFLSLPRMTLEPGFRAESLALPGTRLWFGPKPDAYALGAGDQVLWFQAVATRVYAAGHNPDSPGEESQPAENSRQSIGWWDRHYAEVADYEQEYYVQNEIMKWALATAWLRDRGAGRFLTDERVDHSERFDRWYAKHQRKLRYQHPINLRPASESVGNNECLDLQNSYPYEAFAGDGKVWQVSGGVSVAGREALAEATRINPAIPWLERISNLAMPGKGGRGAGTASRVWPVLQADGWVKAVATSQTKWRTGSSSLELGDITLRSEKTPLGETRLTLGAEHGPIGDFSARSTGEEVKLGWQPGPLEQSRKLAERTLAGGGGKLPPPLRPPPLELPDENAWIVPGSAGSPGVKLSVAAYVPGKLPAPEGPLYTAHRQGSKVAVAQATHLGSEELSAVVDRYRWQRVAFAAGGEVQARAFSNNGPPSGAVPTPIAGYPELQGTLRTPDGRYYVPRPATESARQSWRSLTHPRANRPQTPEVTLVASREATPKVRSASAELAQGRIQESLHYVTEAGPDSALNRVQEVRHALLVEGDQALINGEGGRAGRLFDLVKDMGQAPSDLLLRRGIANIMDGNPHAGLTQLLSARQSLDEAGRSYISRAVDGSDAKRLGDVRDVLAGIAHHASGMPYTLWDKVTWVSDGDRPLTALRLDRPLDGAWLSSDERATVASHPDEVVFYIDDRFSLAKEDLVAAPAESLAELARMPGVSFQEIRAMPTGDYRPGVLIMDQTGTRYRRLDLAERANTRNFGLRAIVIRNCDLNRDGVVTSEEQAQCAL